jgi:hypothetical protein
MPTRTSRLPRTQLELFHPQSETIDWHKLPRERQQEMMTLLTKLLREHSESQLRHAAAREDSQE